MHSIHPSISIHIQFECEPNISTLNHTVLVEKNAGLQSGFSDKSYKEAGASMSSAKDILKRTITEKNDLIHSKNKAITKNKPPKINITLWPVKPVLNQPKFTEKKVTFVNKFGAYLDVFFFKKTTETFAVQDDTYKINNINNVNE